MGFNSIDIALAAALGFIVWAWQNASHRQSITSPFLALLVFIFAAILLLKGWQSIAKITA